MREWHRRIFTRIEQAERVRIDQRGMRLSRGWPIGGQDVLHHVAVAGRDGNERVVMTAPFVLTSIRYQVAGVPIGNGAAIYKCELLGLRIASFFGDWARYESVTYARNLSVTLGF